MSFADVPCIGLGRPTCRRALRSIWASILQTCLALHWGGQFVDVLMCVAFTLQTCVGACNFSTWLVLRWGAQLADVPCVAFGRPFCGRVLRCVGAPNLGEAILKVYLQAKICSYPSSSSSFSLVLPCVDVFVADEFCVWVTILRMCLSLRCGAQLADVRTCLAFMLRTCVGVPNLRTCLALRWGAQLANVPCVAFGRPSCRRALICIGVPNLGEAVLKCLPPSQNLLLSILQLVI
jgi:hypothetical protein